MEVGGKREIINLSLRCHRQAILMFHDCEEQSHKQDSVHRPQLFKRKESRSGFERRPLCLPA